MMELTPRRVSSEPFDLMLVETELQPLKTSGLLQFVGGMVEYSGIKNLSSFVLPSAYVILGPESAKTTATGKNRAQVVDFQFGVVVAVRNNRAGSSGAGALRDTLNPILGAIRDLLIGWHPAALTTPVEWIGGQPLDYDAGTLVWLDRYRAQHTIGRRRCQQ